MSNPPDIAHIANHCLAARVRTLSRGISALYQDALSGLGIKVSQLNILVAVARMGQARPADLCRVLALDGSTLSRNAERLRAKGWIEASPTKGRGCSYRISESGLALIARAEAGWGKAQQEAEAIFGPDGIALLEQALTRLRSRPDSP